MAERISKSIIVDKDISYVYNLWADFDNFPHFMRYIKSVTKSGDGQMSHWVAEGPMGKDLEWDSRATLEENRRVAWQSVSGDIENSGEVTFRKVSEGRTEVTASIEFTPKASLGGNIAGAILGGDAQRRMEEDLQNFKKFAETGQRQAATRKRTGRKRATG